MFRLIKREMVNTQSSLELRSRPVGRNARWTLFLLAMTAASLLPILFIPAQRHLFPNVQAAIYAVALFNILGAQLHVAATGWFYTDPTVRTYFWHNRGRYVFAPIAIIVGTAVVFAAANAATRSYLLGAYLMWQLWHYQKQNFGVLSFVCAGTDGAPLSKWERRTLAAAFLPGALGFLHFFDINLPDRAGEFAQMYHFGVFAYAPVLLCFAIALWCNDSLRRNPLRLAFFVYGSLFFLPTYLFPDAPSAITGFALAHGLQYLVFMTVVSGRTKAPLASLGAFAVISGVGYYLLLGGLALPNATEWYEHLFAGAVLGVVMSHFVIDAGLWRMREPFQRSYIGKKFDFVFNRSSR